MLTLSVTPKISEAIGRSRDNSVDVGGKFLPRHGHQIRATLFGVGCGVRHLVPSLLLGVLMFHSLIGLSPDILESFGFRNTRLSPPPYRKPPKLFHDFTSPLAAPSCSKQEPRGQSQREGGVGTRLD